MHMFMHAMKLSYLIIFWVECFGFGNLYLHDCIGVYDLWQNSGGLCSAAPETSHMQHFQC